MSKEILLNDLLNLSEAEMKKTKIKFHSWNGSVNPIDEYLNDHDIVNNQWLFWRNKRGYFNVGQIAICLVHISADKWLLTTIKKITKELNVEGGINYEGEELAEYQSYYGRVVISYHKDAQQMCRFYDTVASEMIVNQILPAVYDGMIL